MESIMPSMPKDRKKLVNLLTPRQIEETRQKIAEVESFLKHHRNSPFKRVREADETFARQELTRQKRMLEQRTAPEVGDSERNKMCRRVKYLEGKIKEGMPTRDEMMGKRHSRSDNPNSKYQEAEPSIVDRNIKWTMANASRIKEWKYLKRIIDPHTPDATNVEQLRRVS